MQLIKSQIYGGFPSKEPYESALYINVMHAICLCYFRKTTNYHNATIVFTQHKSILFKGDRLEFISYYFLCVFFEQKPELTF